MARRHGFEPCCQAFADVAAALQQVFLFKHIQHGQRGGAGNRAAGVGAAQSARCGGIHHLGAADHRRNRKATGHRFGHGDEVRRDAALFHRKPGAGTPCAGLYLVNNQQNAVAVAQRAQALQQLWRRHMKAAFALHRLDDDGGDAAGLDVVLENRLDRCDRVIDRHAVQCIGEGGVKDLGWEGAKAGLVRGNLARHGQRQQGAAMVATGKTDDT